MAAGEESSAQAYLDLVIRELGRREERLADISRQIQEMEFELDRFGRSRKWMSGQALRVLSAAKYRRHLQQTLEAKQHERAGVVEEIEKARERKQLALEELEAEQQEQEL